MKERTSKAPWPNLSAKKTIQVVVVVIIKVTFLEISIKVNWVSVVFQKLKKNAINVILIET